MIANAEIVEEINEDDIFLRKIHPNDVSFLFESLREQETIKYLSLGPLENMKTTQKLIRGYLYQWEKHKQFNYIIELRKNEEDVMKLGSLSLWNISWKHQRADVGIWLNQKYRNKGYGEKALNLLKIIAFIHLKLHRLQAYVASPNQKSIYLFQRCNFTKEATIKDYLYFNKKFHDATIFRLLKSRYLKNI